MRYCRTADAAAVEITFQWKNDAADVGVEASSIDQPGLSQNRERITQLQEPASQTAAGRVTDAHVLDQVRMNARPVGPDTWPPLRYSAAAAGDRNQ